LLTEVVKAVPGAMLVISIPASSQPGDAGDQSGSDLEVGGLKGREALNRLQRVVRRVADQWRPATAYESFEIVRGRLFTDPYAQGRSDIAAVARAFVQFYAEHRGESPANAARSPMRSGSRRPIRSTRSCSTGCMRIGQRANASSAPRASSG
jgi:hypothetical protein